MVTNQPYRKTIAAALIWAAALFSSLPAWAEPPAIDRAGMVILARNTVIALNHANLTGNYAVLRDLGAPQFILNNSPAKLAASFAALRASGLDLGPVVMFDPIFPDEPKVDDNGLLRLQGYFPTNPLRIKFDLIYTYVQNRWRLASIAVVAAPQN